MCFEENTATRQYQSVTGFRLFRESCRWVLQRSWFFSKTAGWLLAQSD